MSTDINSACVERMGAMYRMNLVSIYILGILGYYVHLFRRFSRTDEMVESFA